MIFLNLFFLLIHAGCPLNEDIYILVVEIVLSAFDMVPHLVSIANNLAEDSSEEDLFYVIERILEVQLFPIQLELSSTYEKAKSCIRKVLRKLRGNFSKPFFSKIYIFYSSCLSCIMLRTENKFCHII